MKKKVSVVIVTRNRQLDLIHCLGSLITQKLVLDELVIVDNNSQDDTKLLTTYLAATVSFPVKYVREKKVGYPVVYNRGLKESQHPWVAFIDDDCIALPGWYKNIKQKVSSDNSVAAIVGKTSTYYKQNIFSLATDFLDNLWKQNRMEKGNIVDFAILDNKNITYNKKFLKKNNISFDETRVNFSLGSSEDCDLGMQIKRTGGKAKYAQNIHTLHKDPVRLIQYYKKLLSSTLGYKAFEKKWKHYRKIISKRHTKIQSLKLLLKYLNQQQINLFGRIQLITLITVSLLLLFIIKRVNKITTTD